jgi:hypothetical protein
MPSWGAHSGEGRQPRAEPARIVEAWRDRRICAPGVVGAELDDDRVGLGSDRPVEARKAVARGISRNAGIDDGHVVAARPEGVLKPDGERLVSGETEARGEAVAEGDDAKRSAWPACGEERHQGRWRGWIDKGVPDGALASIFRQGDI